MLNEARTKLSWLIRLRWAALGVQSLSAIPGVALGFLPWEYVPLYLSIIGSVAFWNLLTARFLYSKERQVTETDLGIQLLADVGTLSLLLSLTGGIYNPFTVFLLVYSVIASLILSGRALAFILTSICLCIGLLQWDPDVSHLSLTGKVTRPILFLAYSVVALFLAFLTAWLSRILSRLRESLETIREQQARLDRLRLTGAMAAGFSHEFSTPLYTLKLRLERIRRKTSAEVLSDVEEAALALAQCETILKTLTQSGLKAEQLHLVKSDLKKILPEWLQEWRRQNAQSAQVHFEVLDSTPEAWTEIPHLPLKKSLFDLLDNALEATLPESAPPRITLHSAPGGILIGVWNQGPPIPQVVLDQWGEPFVTTKPEGTGLGLYNALTLTRALGGQLKCLRHASEWTELQILLPWSENSSS